jgi:hypothetical protein
MHLISFVAARRVHEDLSCRRALELAVDSREAVLGHGVRWQPTSHVGLESPRGARRPIPPLVGTHPSTRVPLAACLSLSRRRPARKGAPLAV